jgi:multiple sugar transport system permease protein
MRQFFMTVPDDLIDAARMDGMSEFSIIWRVMLPTAIPALLAFAIFSVVAHWNDYFWPRIVITGNRRSVHAAAGPARIQGRCGWRQSSDR